MGVSRVASSMKQEVSQQATFEKKMLCSSSSSCPQNELIKCDACPYCPDTCDNVSSCLPCQKKRNQPKHLECRGPETSWLMEALSHIISPVPAESHDDNSQTKTYSMCQLKRHNHADSAWILVGDTIYDATPYIRSHPGGTTTILRKTGGAADCTEDMKFHSKRAQKEWRKHKIGMLCRCPRSA